MGFKGIRVNASDIPDGSITTPKLADGAVTTPKVTDGAVSSPKLQSASVTGAKIADGSISSAKIGVSLSSDNYSPGVAGWFIDRVTGDVEFGSGVFRGLVEAAEIRASDFLTGTTRPRIVIGPSYFESGVPALIFETVVGQALRGNVANHDLGTGTDSLRTQVTSGKETSTGDQATLLLDSAPSGGRSVLSLVGTDNVFSSRGALNNNQLRMRAPSDAAHYLEYNSGDDAAWLHGWRVRLRSGQADVSEHVGGGGFAESRTESRSGTAFRQHTASSHFNTSDRRFKANLRQAPNTFDHARAVVNAPVYHWEDERGHTRCGPLAEDLPVLVTQKTRLVPFREEERDVEVDVPAPEGGSYKRTDRRTVCVPEAPIEDVLLVSTGAQMGIMWGAVAELTNRLAVLERKAPPQ